MNNCILVYFHNINNHKVSCLFLSLIVYPALALLLHMQLGKYNGIRESYALFCFLLRKKQKKFFFTYIRCFGQAQPTFYHATSPTGHSIALLPPSTCPMTSTPACVPIFSTLLPPWRMTTKLLHLNGMMWSCTVNSMPWKTSKCVLSLPSQSFVTWHVSHALCLPFLFFFIFSQERRLENSAVSWWVELWLLRVRIWTLIT